MKVIDIGELIKSERIKKGMTQADLSFDLCTIATLSRIENGLHIPQSRVLFGLLERLDLTDYKLLGPMQDDSDFDAHIHFLEEKLEQLCSEKNWTDFLVCLNELKASNIEYNPADRQFLIVYETIYNFENGRRNSIVLTDLLAAIRLTIPGFSLDSPIEYNLTTNEQYLLIFMVFCCIQAHNDTLASYLIAALKISFDNTIARHGLWSEPVFYYYEILINNYIDNNDYTSALEAINNHRLFCKKQGRFSQYTAYAYEEILCYMRLNMVDDARERILTNYFHLRGIRKQEEAEAFRMRIREDYLIDFRIIERRTPNA